MQTKKSGVLKMPVQAVANGLILPVVPVQLQNLTVLERRCIGKTLPFMTIHSLPKGGQGKITGPCVNVPADLVPICDLLSWLPDEINLIAIKLKRKLVYKGYHMYDFICPDIVMNALLWLRENNPHYKHVTINEGWLDQVQHFGVCNLV